jgi:hypothetical protein
LCHWLGSSTTATSKVALNLLNLLLKLRVVVTCLHRRGSFTVSIQCRCSVQSMVTLTIWVWRCLAIHGPIHHAVGLRTGTWVTEVDRTTRLAWFHIQTALFIVNWIHLIGWRIVGSLLWSFMFSFRSMMFHFKLEHVTFDGWLTGFRRLFWLQTKRGVMFVVGEMLTT